MIGSIITFEELNWRRHEAKRLRIEPTAIVYWHLLIICYLSRLGIMPSPSRRLNPRGIGAMANDNNIKLIPTISNLIS